MLLTTFAVVLVVPLLGGTATADTSGTLAVSSDTTLAEDHQGTIFIDADEIRLDCAGHEVSGPGDPTYGDAGILVVSRSLVVIENCLVTGFTQGIAVVDSQDVEIENNTTFDNPGNGIYVVGSSATALKINEATGNQAQGIHVDASSNVTLHSNTVAATAGSGILLTGSAGNIVSHNDITESGATGIALVDSPSNTVSHNRSKLNGEHGVGLSGSSDGNNVELNVFVDNSVRGLSLDEGADATRVVGNALNRNGFDGIGVTSQDNEIRGNVMNANGIMGASVGAGSPNPNPADNNLLVRNTANRNANTGLYAADGANGNTFRLNMMRGNGGAGGASDNASFNRFIANRSIDNGRGLSISNGSVGNLLFRNAVSGNGSGIDVVSSIGNTVMDNRVVRNVEGGISLLHEASYNHVIENFACRNAVDAYDDGTGAANLWLDNRFCTASI